MRGFHYFKENGNVFQQVLTIESRNGQSFDGIARCRRSFAFPFCPQHQQKVSVHQGVLYVFR